MQRPAKPTHAVCKPCELAPGAPNLSFTGKTVAFCWAAEWVSYMVCFLSSQDHFFPLRVKTKGKAPREMKQSLESATCDSQACPGLCSMRRLCPRGQIPQGSQLASSTQLFPTGPWIPMLRLASWAPGLVVMSQTGPVLHTQTGRGLSPRKVTSDGNLGRGWRRADPS